jgi:CheY-like chemotaxis protein
MPVVALAARDADFDRDGVLRVGFTDCLRAPLEAASLALLASRLAAAASPAVAPLD